MATPRTYQPKKKAPGITSPTEPVHLVAPEGSSIQPRHIPEQFPHSILFQTNMVATPYFAVSYFLNQGTTLSEDIGAGIAIAGSAFTFASQLHMKKHFWSKDSQGQNVNTLATTGAHSLIRNPIYGGIRLANLGYVLANPTPVAMGLCMVVFASSEYLVAIEEKNCRARFGDAYRDYAREVPRWIPKPSTLTNKTREYITNHPTLTNIVNGVTRTLC